MTQSLLPHQFNLSVTLADNQRAIDLSRPPNPPKDAKGLRKWRNERKITQEQIAKALDIHPYTYKCWEKDNKTLSPGVQAWVICHDLDLLKFITDNE